MFGEGPQESAKVVRLCLVVVSVHEARPKSGLKTILKPPRGVVASAIVPSFQMVVGLIFFTHLLPCDEMLSVFLVKT